MPRRRHRAIRDGDNWIISGSKIYITNGPIAEHLQRLAVTDPKPRARAAA